MAASLQTVGILVKDMAATLQFYRTLGLSIPADQDHDANVDVDLPGGIKLGFLTMERASQADPGFITPIGQSMNLQFVCGSSAEVDSTFQELVSAGYAAYAQPWDAFWGQRFARVVDPDGRVINLYAEL